MIAREIALLGGVGSDEEEEEDEEAEEEEERDEEETVFPITDPFFGVELESEEDCNLWMVFTHKLLFEEYYTKSVELKEKDETIKGLIEDRDQWKKSAHETGDNNRQLKDALKRCSCGSVGTYLPVGLFVFVP